MMLDAGTLYFMYVGKYGIEEDRTHCRYSIISLLNIIDLVINIISINVRVYPQSIDDSYRNSCSRPP